jgi:hypothetical protein
MGICPFVGDDRTLIFMVMDNVYGKAYMDNYFR